MKKLIQKLALLVVVGFVAVSCGSSKSATTALPASTTMECTQITGGGDYIVEVQCAGRNVDKATDEALQAAVRGLMFQGIPGSATNRIQSQKPLITDSNVRVSKKEYLDNFFSSGDYRMYAETVPNNFPKAVKVGGGYKVKVSVILKKGLLRRRLEKDGIIKSLAEGFK